MTADAYQERLAGLLGPTLAEVWRGLCSAIEGRYEMERTWGPGGKRWDLEYKYRRGGKTLCALYAAPGQMGLMVVFGRGEREKVEGALPLVVPWRSARHIVPALAGGLARLGEPYATYMGRVRRYL